MLKSSYIKLSFVLMAMVILFAVCYAKLSSLNLTGYSASSISLDRADDKLKTTPDEEDGLTNPESPVYFSIFKFINNFTPVKHEE